MDDILAQKLDQQTALIVPTRSLANHLQERIAARYLQSGQRVWEAPRILLWADFLRLLWQSDRSLAPDNNHPHTLISPNQALLLWTRVIETAQREEQELTLLNVQQTARACLKSSQLMADWQITREQLARDHVSDSQQYIQWFDEYRVRLKKRGLLDAPLLQHLILEQLTNAAPTLPIKQLIWYGFDLTTPAQQQALTLLEGHGFDCRTRMPVERGAAVEAIRYVDERQQLQTVLSRARSLIESDPSLAINIVVPDLQNRRGEVDEMARQVFYPTASPLQMQSNEAVYRLSLGRPLYEYPAIEAAMRGLLLLKNRLKSADLAFILRSSFMALAREFPQQCQRMEAWLTLQRIRTLTLEQLPLLWAECQQDFSDHENAGEPVPQMDGFAARLEAIFSARAALQERVRAAGAPSSRYAVLEFSEWAREFADWLAVLGWDVAGNVRSSSQTAPFSLHFQLLQRWQKALEELAAFSVVQPRAGLTSTLEQFQKLLRDTVFLPRSAAAPVLISGLYEALGQSCDHCFVLGMSEEFPPAPGSDAFVPNQHLLAQGYPEASPQTAVRQAAQVLASLQRTTENIEYSYAEYGSSSDEAKRGPTPLLCKEFAESKLVLPIKPVLPELDLFETYEDARGPAWPDNERVRGGAAIFRNQSQCAFKAFVTHQLGFARDEELEFGLDPLDRGNVVHHLLEMVWGELGSQAELLKLDEEARIELLVGLIDRALSEPIDLPAEKVLLLQHERPRLLALLLEWLELEEKRPDGFTVVEREEPYLQGEWAGIKFKFVVDRVDVTDDGRSVIVDYKTGLVQRKDWQSERLRDPQLPLYALTRDKLKAAPVAGIAIGQLRRGDARWVELAETGIFSAENKTSQRWQDDWQAARAQWPAQFDQLAADFLIGEAEVNPIDAQVCNYCDLAAVCRVAELESRSASRRMDGDDEGGQSW